MPIVSVSSVPQGGFALSPWCTYMTRAVRRNITGGHPFLWARRVKLHRYLRMIGRKARVIGQSVASNAPISQCGPWERVMPRWSRLLTGQAAQMASIPASITALPGSSAIVQVGPPLSCKGPSIGSALIPGQVASG